MNARDIRAADFFRHGDIAAGFIERQRTARTVLQNKECLIVEYRTVNSRTFVRDGINHAVRELI